MNETPAAVDVFQFLTRGVAETTLKRSSPMGLANADKNGPHFKHTIKDLLGAAKGKTCLLVGAGPSLMRQNSLAKLKPVMDRFVIVAADGALGHCLRAGLVPHYVISLDPHGERIVRWFGDEDLTVEKLADDYFRRQDIDSYLNTEEVEKNQELVRLLNIAGPGIKAVLCTSSPENVRDRCLRAGMESYWWNPIYDDFSEPRSITRALHRKNKIPCMNAGGNSGSAGWTLSARVLQADRIVMIGMDFSYYADTSVSTIQYYEVLKEFMAEDEIPSALKYVRNPHTGEQYYTDPAYFWYRQGLCELIKKAPDCEHINATGGGILFGEGIRWMSAEQVVAMMREEGQ